MKKTTFKNSADFDYIERTVWQYCKARKLTDDRKALAFMLATQPVTLAEDIQSFGYAYGDKLADSIVAMIGRVCQCQESQHRPEQS